MALQFNINNITAATYPVNVYVCDSCPDNNCEYCQTFENTSPINCGILGYTFEINQL